MNIELVRNKIAANKNKKVVVIVYGMRNKILRYEGTIHETYPNIFTVMCDGQEKSFSYNDYITGYIKIKLL